MSQNFNFNSHNIHQRYVCINCKGEIGTQMFQYSSACVIAGEKNMMVVIPKNCKLLKIFKLTALLSTDISFCRHFPKLKEANYTAYDRIMVELDNKSVSLDSYLIVYHYLEKYKYKIRRQFSFQDHIQLEADKFLEGVFYKFNLMCIQTVNYVKYNLKTNIIKCYKSNSNEIVTIIGIHAQIIELQQPRLPEPGFRATFKTYIHRALQWYENMYRNVIFVVATNEIVWMKQQMPRNISIVYLEGNNTEIDMAILSSCNHFIASTGTFSWWIGWLTGGHVTYYKWSESVNTTFRHTFEENKTKYFYPSWIGL